MIRLCVRPMFALARTATMALTLTATLAAQAPTSGKLPPVRPLGAIEAKSAELLGAVSSVRALPGGRVLVNDISGRRLLLFEHGLATYTVVADTTEATANAYSSRAAGLLAYRGDSSLFVDPSSLSMFVIDGAGKITRTMAVPRPNEANALIGGPGGAPGFDSKGRLVYRAPPQFNFRGPGGGGGGGGGGGAGIAFTPPQFPDSGALVRLDLATRKMDTVAFVKTAKISMTMSQDANGRVSMSSIQNPMQVLDDWALLADGSIAVIRGRDYHIDWTRADGANTSTGKTPFAWRHLDDSAKVAFLDSTKAAMEVLRAQAQARQAAGGGGVPVFGGPGGPGGGGGGGAGPVISFRMDGGPPGGGERAGDGPRPQNQAPGTGGALTIPPLQFVGAAELPDYAPPFAPGAARGDADGNLWIRTSNVMAGGSVYDVINVSGELIDRVQMPAGRVIAGFGTGGVVYMGVRDATGVRLEAARRAK